MSTRFITVILSLKRLHQAKTIEVDKLRFSEKDLTRIGTLEHGSFGEVCCSYFVAPSFRVVTSRPGQIEIVSCILDGMVYARKIINKHFALRNRDVRVYFCILVCSLTYLLSSNVSCNSKGISCYGLARPDRTGLPIFCARSKLQPS